MRLTFTLALALIICGAVHAQLPANGYNTAQRIRLLDSTADEVRLDSGFQL